MESFFGFIEDVNDKRVYGNELSKEKEEFQSNPSSSMATA